MRLAISISYLKSQRWWDEVRSTFQKYLYNETTAHRKCAISTYSASQWLFQLYHTWYQISSEEDLIKREKNRPLSGHLLVLVGVELRCALCGGITFRARAPWVWALRPDWGTWMVSSHRLLWLELFWLFEVLFQTSGTRRSIKPTNTHIYASTYIRKCLLISVGTDRSSC